MSNERKAQGEADASLQWGVGQGRGHDIAWVEICPHCDGWRKTPKPSWWTRSRWQGQTSWGQVYE